MTSCKSGLILRQSLTVTGDAKLSYICISLSSHSLLYFFSSFYLSLFVLHFHPYPAVLFEIVHASLRSHVDLRTKGTTIAMVVAGTATGGEISSRSSVWIWTNIRTIVFGSLLPSAVKVNLDFCDKSAADRRFSLSPSPSISLFLSFSLSRSILYICFSSARLPRCYFITYELYSTIFAR